MTESSAIPCLSVHSLLSSPWTGPSLACSYTGPSQSWQDNVFKLSIHRNKHSEVQGGQGPAQGHSVLWCTACSSLSVPTSSQVPVHVSNQYELWHQVKGLREFGNRLEFKVWLLQLWTCLETLATNQSLSFSFLGFEIMTPSLQSSYKNIEKVVLWETESGPELVQLKIVFINMNTHPLAHCEYSQKLGVSNSACNRFCFHGWLAAGDLSFF